MKVGIEIDWQRRRFDINRRRVKLADRLGYDMAFCAEFTGSDALTPLGYILGCTDRIGVGTRIAQVTARSAPALAMAFQTLKQLGGDDRQVIAGLGSSNPVATEAWHGAKWLPAGPKMRDYVAIMRKAASGGPVAHEGAAISIPYREPGQAPQHPNALSSILETDPSIPIMFGGGTEYMITMAAEIADGLLPNGSWSPGMMKVYRPMIERGFARRKDPPKVEDFPIWAHVDVVITDDIPKAMGQFREYAARYVGGYLGKGGLSTHMEWRGYGEPVQRITELYQAGRIKEAEAAVPDEYIDECWLIGPLERVVERWRTKWINDGCNLIVRTDNWPSAKPANDEVYEPLMRALRD